MKKILILLVAMLTLATTQAQVKWNTMAQAAKTEIGQRLYFVDFYTSWCGYCKKMDRNTFTDSTVAKILNQYFYPVKFDAESTEQVEWFGRKYSSQMNGRARIHELAAGVTGFPTYRLYRADGSVLQDIPGYYPPREFVVVLWYFASGDYNRYTYADYKKIFDAEIRPVMEKKLNTK